MAVPCPVCGLEEARIGVDDAAAALRTFPRRYREVLEGVDDLTLRRRPDTTTWSMLEYAVHVREVLELLALGLPLVLTQARPVFPDLDPDEAAATRPASVMDREHALRGIAEGATTLADQIDVTPYAAWDRPFVLGEEERAARVIPQHAAHEGAHHLRDIERVREAVKPARDDA